MYLPVQYTHYENKLNLSTLLWTTLYAPAVTNYTRKKISQPISYLASGVTMLHFQTILSCICNTELTKHIKIGSRYKFVPKKLYVYNSLIASLERLVSRPDFLNQCEKWRNHVSNTHSGWLTDVYDDKLWKEWLRKDGKPFLDAPYNLLLMMNVDWFRPFKHSTYSIGVIYLVIQNLPRSLRFKLQSHQQNSQYQSPW